MNSNCYSFVSLVEGSLHFETIQVTEMVYWLFYSVLMVQQSGKITPGFCPKNKQMILKLFLLLLKIASYITLFNFQSFENKSLRKLTKMTFQEFL